MDTQEKDSQTGSGTPEQSKKSSGYPALFFLVGFIATLISGWVFFPDMLYSKKEQPFDFNHQLHMDELGDCESCHFFREDGTYAGVPTLDQCYSCHESMLGDTEDEEIFVYDYVQENREVPWLVYSRQPDCVFFSHAAHVKMAEMTCEECHGDIGYSTSLKTYQENKLTTYSRDIWGNNIAGIKENSWDRMKMDDCGNCHLKEMGSKGPCFQCHK